MVVIVGMFYWKSVQRMRGEAALWRAADEVLAFLEGTGRKNVWRRRSWRCSVSETPTWLSSYS